MLLIPHKQTFSCGTPAGHAGGDQVATGWRFPVQHFAGTENAGQMADHQVFIEGFKQHAARAADGFVKRTRRDQAQRQLFDGTCQFVRIEEILTRNAFVQQGHFDALEPETALKMAGE